jgi:hypothetical protein
MPVYTGTVPANVTPDPETQYTGPLKSVFPGSRAANVTLDPQRDGDTNTRAVRTATYAATPDPLRAGDPSQSNNASYGGQTTPGGSYSYPSNSPDHTQASDTVNLAKPSAVTGVTATAGAGQVSVAFTPGAVKGGMYFLKLSPGGKTKSGDASPLVITGLTAGAYTGTIVGQNDSGQGASAAVSSFTVT